MLQRRRIHSLTVDVTDQGCHAREIKIVVYHTHIHDDLEMGIRSEVDYLFPRLCCHC